MYIISVQCQVIFLIILLGVFDIIYHDIFFHILHMFIVVIQQDRLLFTMCPVRQTKLLILKSWNWTWSQIRKLTNFLDIYIYTY